jgi:hypothetical protein
MASNDIQEILDNGGFLGQGWAFPPTFVRGANTVILVKETEDIQQSLMILLSTALGERVMRADFGCNLDQQVFEPLSLSFQTFLSDLVRKAIERYETRITIDNIDITVDNLEGRVNILVVFTIISTNSRSNIVYPYYLNEGTNVEQ